MRVFEPQQRKQRREGQDTTADSQQETPPATPATDDLAVRMAALDAEVRGLKELLAEVRQSRDAWQAQAEDWKTQASRLTIALPAPALGPIPAPPAKLPWWRRLQRAG